ncbi:unnamed protein product, partial [Staurois parvus]
MDTDRWHCWGYSDHQDTLIISALMITVSMIARVTDHLTAPLSVPWSTGALVHQ